MSFSLDAIIFAVGWTQVILAPFTKVEESFNLHATHDVLMYGIGKETLHNYDHFTFPGAVPRTFISSVVLAWFATPLIRLAKWGGFFASKFELQILVRLVLASLNSWTLSLVRRAVTRRFGRTTGLLFSLLTCTQFHYPFWMGRTIPNMFATVPVTLSTYLLVDRAPNAAKSSQKSINATIVLLTFTGVVLRAEVALLLAPLSIQLLLSRQISFFSLIKVGLISAAISLGLTVTVDSYFWGNYPLWPEFSGIYFNVVEGKSSDWGTSPPFTYVMSFLPKLLLGSLPLSMLGFAIDHRIRSLLLPSLLFISLISILGHKEWRFIVYVVPVLNIAAARGSKWMVSRRKNNFFGRLLFLAAAGIIAANLAITIVFTKASISNYPGGLALLEFHRIYPKSTYPSPNLHISNLAAQTGASLFLQLNAPPQYSHSNKLENAWSYNKTENLTLDDLSTSSSFTHLISEIQPSTDRFFDQNWRLVKAIRSFDRWAVNWDLLTGKQRMDLSKRLPDVLLLEESDKLWILERVDHRN